MCLVSKCLDTFLLSSCQWFLIWFQRIKCSENLRIRYVWFLILLHLFFHDPVYVFHGHLEKKCVFCYYSVQCSRNVDYIMLVDGGGEFLHTLVDFSINCWQRKVEVSKYNCAFVNFFLQFYWFCFIYFAVLVSGAYMFRIVMSCWWIDICFIK